MGDSLEKGRAQTTARKSFICNKTQEIEKALIGTSVNEITTGRITRTNVNGSNLKPEMSKTLENLGFRKAPVMNEMFVEY